MPTPHPTQILMHNPLALRLEFRIDDGALILWWSPKAGQSYACADRNFSNRDNHLNVFESIRIRGCERSNFKSCDYDPYHSVLHFDNQRLHLAILPEHPVVLIWAEKPLTVDIKTDRYDEAQIRSAAAFDVLHTEASYTFAFSARLSAGSGAFRHGDVSAPWNSYYSQATLEEGQILAFGVGLKEDGIAGVLAECLQHTSEEHLQRIDTALEPIETMGRITASDHPEMETLQRTVVRGLHSMIDLSGTFRASIKAIYYLIWVRDAGFSFAYQAAAGWPHKLGEMCRLLLSNPTTAQGDKVPAGRMFGQLINTDYGKYEEDGAYYVIWSIFTHWTQTGSRACLGREDQALLTEAVDWIEHYIFDEARGLFGEHFADETPAYQARDYGWDYAIGMPSGDEAILHEGKRVIRSYDIYINLLMHAAYTMLAAMTEDTSASRTWTDKASKLWKQMRPFFENPGKGLPPYGELVLENGNHVLSPHWGPASSTYIWGLTMPSFVPFDGWDDLRKSLLNEIMRKPAMHWINGICGAVAAVDPWLEGEDELLQILLDVKDETLKPGPFLPMGGAMPEKFDAPQGNLYHDIRPQGFAMGAWLAAWAALGVRRLPYGLALRPTRAFQKLENYAWRNMTIDFLFSKISRVGGLVVNGTEIPHTLQVPSDVLSGAHAEIALIEATAADSLLLLRSTIELLSVRHDKNDFVYQLRAYGLSSLDFSRQPAKTAAFTIDGESIDLEVSVRPRITTLKFTAWGEVELRCSRS